MRLAPRNATGVASMHLLYVTASTRNAETMAAEDPANHRWRHLRLPTPNEEEIAAFAVLYKQVLGVDLGPTEAADLATRLVRIAYMKSFSNKPYVSSKDEDISDENGIFAG